MNTNVEIGGGQAIALRGAVLLYSGTGRAFCTWHEAQRTESGEAQLGTATALTSDFVRSLASGLGQRVRIEIFPDGVLACADETTVWWTPATVRPMFFRSTDDDSGEISGRRFPQPALVWRVRGHDLSVRALARNQRPEADSKLCVAPYFNTDGEDGSVCQGSMRSPDEAGVGAISVLGAGVLSKRVYAPDRDHEAHFAPGRIPWTVAQPDRKVTVPCKVSRSRK
jgi:PRTRC genetic system protein B